MLFSLRLLFVFAISVVALPPSPHSIDTTVAGRQLNPASAAGGCKNQTIIEQITLESGVVATHYGCNDSVERMERSNDGLGKRDSCFSACESDIDPGKNLCPPGKHRLTCANIGGNNGKTLCPPPPVKHRLTCKSRLQ